MEIDQTSIVHCLNIPQVDQYHRLGDDDLCGHRSVEGFAVAPNLFEGFETQILGPQFLVHEPVSHVMGASDVPVVKSLEGDGISALQLKKQLSFGARPFVEE